MSKKLVFLLILILAVGANGATSVWTGFGGTIGLDGTDWNQPANWSAGIPTATADQFNIGSGNGTVAQIINIYAGQSNLGVPKGGSVGWSPDGGLTSSNATLNVAGTLNIQFFATMAREVNDVGTINILPGGVWNLGKNICPGRNGQGFLNVEGAINGSAISQLQVPSRAGNGEVRVTGNGSISVGGRFGLPHRAQGTYNGSGQVYIQDNGSITAGNLKWGTIVGGLPVDYQAKAGTFIELDGNGKLVLLGADGYDGYDIALAIAQGVIVGKNGQPVGYDIVGGIAGGDSVVTIGGTYIPEPMTIALLGLGGLFIRRKK